MPRSPARRAELGIVDPGDHHDRRVRARRPELLEQAVAGLIRQANIEQRDRVVLLLDQRPGLTSAERHVALEAAAAEGAGHHLRQGLLVFHDEDALGGFGGGHGQGV